MRTPRAVVTGIAASSCVGEGVEPLVDALAGRLPGGVAMNGADRTFRPLPDEVATHPRIRSTHPLTMRLVWTVERALGDFLGALSEQERERTGVSFGHAYGHLGSYFDYFDAATLQGYRVVHPLRFLSTLTNYAAAEVNNAYSLWGSSIPVGTGWNAGIEAIGAAVDAVASGDDETMVAGGFEEVSEATRRVLTAAAEPVPAGAASHASPTPTAVGEGIGILLLQSAYAAARAGRTPLAEIGPVTCLHGMVWADPAAIGHATSAIARALEEAGVRGDEVDVVFASAIGFPRGSEHVAEVMAALPGGPGGARRVDVSSVTGQCFAAAGALQCVAAVAAVSPDRVGTATGGAFSASHKPAARAALVLTLGAEGSLAAVAFRAANPTSA